MNNYDINDLRQAWYDEMEEFADEVDHLEDWQNMVKDWLADQGCSDDEVDDLMATEPIFRYRN